MSMSEEELDESVVKLAQLKKRAKVMAEQISQLQDDVINEMKHRNVKTKTVLLDRDSHRATLVESSTIVLDEDRLKKALSAPVFNKYTKRVLDNDKLESAMAAGEVDPNVVASCSEEKPRKPYIKLT